jgi:type I restriction enzyme S subunit
MAYKNIGDYVRLVDIKNTDGKVTNLLGINITKSFMPSVANTTETDLTKYKVIRRNQFAYSAMQVGRDETIRIALYEDEQPAIISPAYLVIEVIDENVLSPKYMMMCFQRAESDRYGWFISDSTVRASLDWDRFREIRIPIPDIEKQKKYVAIYETLTAKKNAYREGIESLQFICDMNIEGLIKTCSPSSLGNYIEQSEERNSDEQVDNLLGISTNKQFIKTNSKKEQLDLSSYKVVRKSEFGYVPDTSRRGDKIAIALLDGDPGLISSVYTVFRVKDASTLLPEYLYLWFKRAEFDRYARFHSWGSARETFDWSDMCKVKMPIPSIEAQRAIVSMYQVLESRNKILNEIESHINTVCPVLMSGLINELSIH